MEKWSAVAQVVAPIFASVLLGILAKRRKLIAGEAVKGMQQYVMTFGLPAVIFNSCLNAAINAQSLISFAMVLPTTFTIARVFAPRRWHSFMAAMVSAVSPDWDRTMSSVCSSISGSA